MQILYILYRYAERKVIKSAKKRRRRKSSASAQYHFKADGNDATASVVVSGVHDLQQPYTAKLPRRTNRARRPVKRESSPELTPTPKPSSPTTPSTVGQQQGPSRQSEATMLERAYPVSRPITDEEKQQIRAHIASHPGDPPMAVARVFNIGRKQAWHMISRVLPDRPALRRRVNQEDVDRVRDIITNSPYLSYNNMAKKLNMAKSTFQHIARERLRKRARKPGGIGKKSVIDNKGEGEHAIIDNEKVDEEKPQSIPEPRKRRSRAVKQVLTPATASVAVNKHESPVPTTKSAQAFSPVKTRSKRQKTLHDENRGILPCCTVDVQKPWSKRKPRVKAVRKNHSDPIENEKSEVTAADATDMSEAVDQQYQNCQVKIGPAEQTIVVKHANEPSADVRHKAMEVITENSFSMHMQPVSMRWFS